MKFKHLLFLGLTLAAAIGCHHERHHQKPPAKLLVTHPIRKATELVREYVGQVHAIQHIELRALERGYLQGIFVDEGQTIEKSQRMFQIMPMIYQAETQKAQAEAELAQIEYKNTKILADENVVSPNELALSKAKVSKAQAELTLATTHQGLAEIRAPFEGIMGRFHVRQGSLVEEGELLTTLADNSKVWVYFNVSEAEYLDFKKSAHRDEQPTVKLMMANGELFDHPGKVETIEADFNNETGNIAFRATFPNPDGLLRHGETGKILMSQPLENALVIPQKATFEILDKKFVYVIDKGGIVRSRAVSIKAEMPQVYVLEKGVSEDEKILVEGLRKVRDGSRIEQHFEEPSKVLAKLDLHAE